MNALGARCAAAMPNVTVLLGSGPEAGIEVVHDV